MVLETAIQKELMSERTPRVEFRRVAAQDVRLRRVRLREVWKQAQGAGVHEGGTLGARDSRAPGLIHGRCNGRGGGEIQDIRTTISAQGMGDGVLTQ